MAYGENNVEAYAFLDMPYAFSPKP